MLRALATTLALTALALPAAAQLRIVTTIEPYREPLVRLAGPGAEVDVLLPPGASPHAFDPTPRDVVRLAEADLVVINGGLDAWALELAEAAGGDRAPLVLLDALPSAVLLDGIHDHAGDHEDDGHDAEPHEADAHDAHEHDADESDASPHDDAHGGDASHAAGEANPHVWLDPRRMSAIVDVLEAELARLAPDQVAAIAERADAYRTDLAALDADAAARLAPFAGAPFVPFHDAWPYFADRYGLDLVLEIEPFPGREPSARELADAVRRVREVGATAVFNEAQLMDRPARVLADEADIRLGTLDPLGGVEGREGYLALMRFNVGQLVATLGAPATEAP